MEDFYGIKDCSCIYLCKDYLKKEFFSYLKKRYVEILHIMICNTSTTALKCCLGFSFLIDVSMCSKFKHTLANVENRLVYLAATGQMREYGAGSSNHLSIMWFKKNLSASGIRMISSSCSKSFKKIKSCTCKFLYEAVSVLSKSLH